MDEQIWTFSRDEERLEIHRTPTLEGFLMGVRGDGPPRTYFFADLEKLEAFQADFEKFLLGTGWLFVSFAPERRAGRERRHFSRLMSDRRRWWTDGIHAPGRRQDDPPRERQPMRRRPR